MCINFSGQKVICNNKIVNILILGNKFRAYELLIVLRLVYVDIVYKKIYFKTGFIRRKKWL